uniref:50S ribosomal L9 C-terminal domain-containing protein n=1 Tax=Staphylococcus saprophyticus TaxID=29385 RepID=UPI00370463E9
SLTTKQITQPLQQQHHINIHKPKIHLPNPIHPLRYTNLPLKLHKQLQRTIPLHTLQQ